MTTYPQLPKSRIELHVHLDGSFRPSTVWHYAKKRNLHLPPDCVDVETLKKHIQIGEGADLVKFLETFSIFTPSIAGDLEAIERASYEFVEDVSKHEVAYCEVRYCPHLWASSVDKPDYAEPGDITPKQVVESANRGLKRGEKEFGVKVRSILCCMRHRPEWSKEVLNLCVEFKNDGVVAIDIAGDERLANPTHELHIKTFQEAKRLGINRTVHAGENGGPENVLEAINKMHAQRIGHGYGSMRDPTLYKRLVDSQVHFECCPWSSIKTGSVEPEAIKDPTRLPCVKLFEDGANISLNTDDPTVTGMNLSQEYEFLAKKVKLPFKYVAKANLNAAKSSFLPEDEREELVLHVQEIYKDYLE